MTVLGNVALLEEMCHVWMGFEVSFAQTIPSMAHSLSLVPADQDVELSAPSSAPCLSASLHVSCHYDNRLNL